MSECAAQQIEELARTHEAQINDQQAHILSLEAKLAELSPGAAAVPTHAPSAAAAPAASQAAVGETSHKQAWRTLVNMGFNSEMVRDVVAKTDGDVDAATTMLLEMAA